MYRQMSSLCSLLGEVPPRWIKQPSDYSQISDLYSDANPMIWRPAADLLLLHVFVQSLVISNLIPHFVLSKYSLFSICIVNPSISASKANLIFYFFPAHPTLLMVIFATPPTLSVVSLETYFFGCTPLKFYFSDSPLNLSPPSILPDTKINT